MKFKILSLTVFVLGSAAAFAAPELPLLSKSSGGGFVMPEYGRVERCELFADRVVVSHQLGFGGPTAIQVSETRPLQITGDIKGLIEKAVTEQIVEKPNYLCDGPSTSILANPKSPEAIVLFSTGGCGSPSQDRQGLASNKLKEILGLYCPTTISFGIEN